MFELALNDGGRQAAGYKGKAGDCVVRAIVIAKCFELVEQGKDIPGEEYQSVVDGLKYEAKSLADNGRCRLARGLRDNPKAMNPRTGVNKKIYDAFLKGLGWEWKAVMGIGTGCKVHVLPEELPTIGPIILRLSKHLSTVKVWHCLDSGKYGRIYDTYDSSRAGTRCVYGYYFKP